VSPTLGTLAALDLLGSPAFGATVGVDVELVPRLHAVVSGFWLPDVGTSDGRFAFGLYAGGAGACFDVASGRRLQLALCGELLAGVIHDDVYAFAPLPPGGRPWFASRAMGRVRAGLVGSLFLELDVGAVVPFVRYEFEVAGRPGMVLHEPSVAPAAGLGAGVTFR
jgi:hypothetical protein